MHNLSDEEMDRLSRDAAEQYTAPVSPGNWEKISARLDEEMPPADPVWKKFVWPISDLLLLLLVFLFFTFQNPAPPKSTAININNNGAGSRDNVVNNSTGQTEQLNSKKENIEQGSGSEAPLTSTPKTEKINPENNNGNIQRALVRPVVAENKSGRNGKAQTPESSLFPVGKKTTPDNGKLNDKKVAEDPATVKINNVKDHTKLIPADDSSTVALSDLKKDDGVENPGNIPVETNKVPVKTDPISTLETPPGTVNTERDIDSLHSQGAAVQKKAKKALFTGKKGKWEAGIVYSPDFSKVGDAKAVKYGSNWGIVLGYHLDQRWSVQTGAVYSRKYYTAIGNGYQKVPGYNYYDPSLKVKKVQAECNMWEVPVNIRYNWLLTRNQKAFVSAGVSSYFMQKEDLKYWYMYNSNSRYKEWVNEQNSSYWFSVAGLSVGFEQYITPSISIQAEPFFRFTLKEVGYGQINLKTMGIFLGVKYSPPPRSSKK